MQATGNSTQPVIGAVLGLATAVALGYLFYKGAVRINLAKFFKWTGAALIVVAAGVLAYGIHDLQEAGVLPGIGARAFDISASFPADSWYATLLRGTVNFTPTTTWFQAIAWTAYMAIVGTFFFRRPRAAVRVQPRPTAGVAAS